MVQVQGCVAPLLVILGRHIDCTADSRRAVFHVGNSSYASKLVDLPCIIESHKTLDNKQMFKVADICQVSQLSHLVKYG